MREGRHHRASHHLGPAKRDVPETFFRLCHHCLYLNESSVEIEHCQKCETAFNSSPKISSDPEEARLDKAWEEILAEDAEPEETSPTHSLPRKQLMGLNVKW